VRHSFGKNAWATIPKKKGGKNMKKGLLFTLVLSIALLASSAFSYAPVLNPLPDVVIGDADEPGFWTTDVNLFRFTDAFAFDDYIYNDTQTTPSQLRWVFIEDPLELGALEINDIVALDPGTEDPHNPPGGKDLRAADPMASFRDIHASPHSFDAAVLAGSPNVYPGDPKCDQFITFWVSESVQNKADSDTIYVKSIDGVVDTLSGGARFIDQDTFDTGSGDFTWAPITGFTLPTSQSGGGTIGLEGPAAGSRFGFWQTPGTWIPYEAGQIFRCRYFLSRGSALTTPDNMPQIRMRMFANNLTGSASATLSSADSLTMVPPVTPATKEYRTYFYPITDTGGIGAAFDMLDFSPTELGLVLLDRIVAEKIDRATLGAATAVKTFDTDLNTWEFNVNFGGAFGAVSSAGSSADHVVLTSTVAASQAGMAQSPANSMAYDLVTAHLYRAAFDVSRGAADPMLYPTVRLRAFSEDNQIAAETSIVHGNSPGAGSPAQTPAVSTFEVYWETPDIPASPTTNQDGFRAAFDLLDFSPTEGDAAYLEKLAVEYFAIPAESIP